MRLRPSTVEQYRNRLRVRIYPVLGRLPLTSLTREVARTALGDMVRAGNLRTPDRPVARATVREAVTTLSTILATAVEDGLILANPCTRLRKHIGNTGGQEAHEVEVFTRAELPRLLAVAGRDYPGWYPFVLCLARTGMRLGEAVALRWADVDLQGWMILVRRSQRKGRVSEPKSGKARRVDMSGHLTTALRDHKSFQEAEAALQGHTRYLSACSRPSRGKPWLTMPSGTTSGPRSCAGPGCATACRTPCGTPTRACSSTWASR